MTTEYNHIQMRMTQTFGLLRHSVGELKVGRDPLSYGWDPGIFDIIGEAARKE